MLSNSIGMSEGGYVNVIKKIGQFLAVFFGLFATLTLLFFIIINLDLAANGDWLLSVGTKWRWYNYLLSHHSLAVLYMQNNFLWLIPSFVASIVGSICFISESNSK